MTDLLARLRAVNPVPRCDAPAIENVWRRLEHDDQVPAHNASRRQQPAPAPRPAITRALGRVRLRVGHVGLGLAVAVPVLVAALAIVVLGHNHGGRLVTVTGPARSPNSRARSRSTLTGSKLPRATGLRAPDANLALPIVGSSGTRTLASFRGKVVVLNVFASWCEPCRAETAALQQAQAVIAGQNATVLGVTYRQTAGASRAFLHEAHITYPVLRDPSGRFSRSLGISDLPATLVIDPRGHVVAAQIGQIGDQWLTRALRHVPGSEHVIPTGLPLRSPPTPPQLAAMADVYPVLARPQRPSDIPPAGALDPVVASQGGLIANTRRALITSRGESLYIVPAHQSICVISSDNVIDSCQPFPFTPTTPAEISATICAPNLPATELEVAGLLPPGASDIKARYSNGTTRAVTAANSMIAIYARFDQPLPKSITWTSPNGPRSTRTGIPPDAATSHCAS